MVPPHLGDLSFVALKGVTQGHLVTLLTETTDVDHPIAGGISKLFSRNITDTKW